MDVGTFYGSKATKSSRDLKRIRRLERAEFRVQSDFLHPDKGSTLGHEFQIFSSQSLAIETAAKNKTLMTFAFEIDSSGRRHFYVSSAQTMWDLLQSRKRHKRHFYEVIPLGHPCKPYFDIEYQISGNEGRDGEKSLDQFLQHLKSQIQNTFHIGIADEDVIDLDSSSKTKFSHHLIIDHPGLIFSSNLSWGQFVRKIMDDMPENLLETITFNKDSGTDTFIDLGVYTKNRNFRMFTCSKWGKTSALKLTERSPLRTMSARKLFLKSLICYFENGPPEECFDFGQDPIKTKMSDAKRFKYCEDDKFENLKSASPFPEIDDFILSKIEDGKIRKILWKDSESTLEYEILNYRYCENVKRWHKSNNIKFVVLLNRGVYFQLCHDPDCKDFKSDDWKLPLDCQPWTLLFDDQNDFTEDTFGTEEEDQFLLEAAKDY